MTDLYMKPHNAPAALLRKALFAIFLAVFVTSCGTDEKPSGSTGQDAPAENPSGQSRSAIPRFQEDSAFAFVGRQVAFGPRVPGTSEHKACKDWLVTVLDTYADEVKEQPFTARTWQGKSLQSYNIIASFNPGVPERILLAAHWDTRAVADHDPDPARRSQAILGADDGGSGVGVLIEIARLLKEHPVDIGVDIVLFDAEDQGNEGGGDMNSWCLGAQYWSRNPHVPGYTARFGILLDMVGAQQARFTKEAISMNFAGPVMDKVWQMAQSMGYSGYFVNEPSQPITDDHYFVNTIARIPMIDIINRPQGSETGFGHYWHTHADNMEVIDKRTLRAVGQVVLAVIYRHADGTFL